MIYLIYLHIHYNKIYIIYNFNFTYLIQGFRDINKANDELVI